MRSITRLRSVVVTVKGKHDAWSGPTSDTQMWQSADRETLLYISCDTDTGCSSKRLNTTLIHDDGRIHGSFWCIVAALKDQSYWPRGGCKQRPKEVRQAEGSRRSGRRKTNARTARETESPPGPGKVEMILRRCRLASAAAS